MSNKKAFGCLPDLVVFILLSLFGLFLFKAYGTDRYVSITGNDTTGDGTEANPYRTITKGYTVAVSGDTVKVKAGVYTNEFLTVAKSGITFLGIDLPSVGQFYIKTNSNVTVNGFEMTAPGGFAAYPGGYIDVRGTCTNIYILSNVIHGAHSYVNGIKVKEHTSANSSNIIYHPNTVYIRGNRLYDLGEIAVSVLGQNHVIENNIFTNIVDFDVLQVFGTNHLIRSNLFSGITRSGSAHVDIFQSFANGLSSSAYGNIIFEANIITNCPGCQLFNIESYSYGAYSNFTFRNNLYASIGFAGNMYAPGLTFVNNTCWRSTTNTTGPVLLRLSVTGKGRADNSTIKNNLFIECGSSPSNTTMGWYYVDAGLTNLDLDYNFVAGPAGATKTTFTNETHGINGGDIKFVSTNNWNFALQAISPAVNKGIVLSGFTNDINGVDRGTNWDMGAYEYYVAHTTNSIIRPRQPERTSWILNRLYHLIGRNRKPRKQYAKKNRLVRRACAA